MKTDVMVKLITTQTTDADETDTLEVNARGTYEKTKTGYIIQYNEIDEEMADCVTTLIIDSPDCVTLSREGSFTSRFIIEKSKRHNCHYFTPAGELMMGVFASDVSVSLNETGGKVKMKYTIDFNSNMVAENTVTLSVKTI